MRKSKSNLNPSFKRQLEKTLAQTLVDFENLDDTHKFLKDFLTDTEYEVFAKRLAIAYWLKKGRSYKNIKQNLKVSSATIATVQSELVKPGYKLAIKNMEAEEWANVWSKRIKKIIK